MNQQTLSLTSSTRPHCLIQLKYKQSDKLFHVFKVELVWKITLHIENILIDKDRQILEIAVKNSSF